MITLRSLALHVDARRRTGGSTPLPTPGMWGVSVDIARSTAGRSPVAAPGGDADRVRGAGDGSDSAGLPSTPVLLRVRAAPGGSLDADWPTTPTVARRTPPSRPAIRRRESPPSATGEGRALFRRGGLRRRQPATSLPPSAAQDILSRSCGHASPKAVPADSFQFGDGFQMYFHEVGAL